MSQNITYLTTTNELNSIANAIRTKGGTSATLEYPQGFIDAIDDIQTGGGGTDSQPSDNSIILSDYVNVAGNQFTFMQPTKATIKGSADMFNRTDVNALAGAFDGSYAQHAFLEHISTVIYDINGTITRIPNYYANDNEDFPYPPQSILDNVTHIGDYAYHSHGKNSVTANETLNLPNIQSIGPYAFFQNRALVKLTIGTYGNSNLQEISQNAFRYCTNLTEIYILEKPSSVNTSSFRDNNANCVMNVVWSQGEVANFPGNFTGTVNYDYVPPQS